MREMKEKTSSRKTGKGQAKPKTRGTARLGLMNPLARQAAAERGAPA